MGTPRDSQGRSKARKPATEVSSPSPSRGILLDPNRGRITFKPSKRRKILLRVKTKPRITVGRDGKGKSLRLIKRTSSPR